MTGFLQRLVGGDAQGTVETQSPQLTLAAFGKHPGWDDHIPGIGVVTETLAQVKQSLYVAGIGGQIDSGAWEKLEAGRRIEGFNHTFLWCRSRHILLGKFWSSTDRKGRAKYPMVLCVESKGVTPRFLLTHVRPELDRLREACRAAATAEQVATVCAAGQDRLDALLHRHRGAELQALETAESRRRFLEHPSLGPDRLGLLRIQHELASAFDTVFTQGNSARDAANVRARHLRVPLAGDSMPAQLVLWAEFFQCAIPPSIPVLLIGREGANWIEVISGEPAKDDFFCLQAMPAAIPIATQIPYEIPPESQARLQELEKRFLTTPGAPTPPPVPRAAATTSAPARKGRSWWFVIALILVLAGVAGWLLMPRDAKKPSVAVDAEVKPPAAREPAVPESNAPAALTTTEEGDANRRAEEQAKAEIEARIRADEKSKADAEKLRLAREQLAAEAVAKQEAEARRLADEKAKAEAEKIAEAKRAAEAEAARLAEEKRIAEEKAAAEARKIEEEKARIASAFAAALEAGRSALNATNYVEALAKAEQALKLKPGDATAVAFKSQVEQARAWVEAEAYFAKQEYEAALAVCARYSGVADFDALATKAREAQSQSAAQQSQRLVQDLDTKFEVLRVKFGLLKAGDAITDDARKAKPLGGLSNAEVEFYLERVDQLEKAYPAEALSQNDRAANLKSLKKEIRYARPL